MRFGIAEAHGRAEMMEFNYLVGAAGDQSRDIGRYAIDFAKMPAAIAALAKELLEIEATGDRARAEAWFAKYDKMPAIAQGGAREDEQRAGRHRSRQRFRRPDSIESVRAPDTAGVVQLLR